MARDVADCRDFLNVVHDIVETIPDLCSGKRSAIELVISADVTYGLLKELRFGCGRRRLRSPITMWVSIHN